MESAKECVTTHLPNELALKMDGAQAGRRNSTIAARVYGPMSRRAWRCSSDEAQGVSPGGAVSSADLGDSSK